ncbi:hypothetical protein HPB50_007318 [Hyalomma asiaticum]|uniref:Uncharacterized protein n=1 Tax=Hyalomma asiaticum TaxID=266040 RepID=A0ACB7STZ3_HYAAI|nr:hypothetical protein HPB50_007318 [Hyalomma asiaticum]
MTVGMQENIRNLQMAVANLVGEVASIECNVNSIMAACQQQQPKIVQQQLQYNVAELLKTAAAVAGRNPLIVGSDFNAPSKTWGYTYDTSKGRQLWRDATELRYTLITDPTNPTRLGTSTCRDTTPNLAFVKHARDVTWRNTMADLVSDHMIVEITVLTQGQMVRNMHEFRWTDWEEFRSKRQALSSDDPITDIEEGRPPMGFVKSEKAKRSDYPPRAGAPSPMSIASESSE